MIVNGNSEGKQWMEIVNGNRNRMYKVSVLWKISRKSITKNNLKFNTVLWKISRKSITKNNLKLNTNAQCSTNVYSAKSTLIVWHFFSIFSFLSIGTFTVYDRQGKKIRETRDVHWQVLSVELSGLLKYRKEICVHFGLGI